MFLFNKDKESHPRLAIKDIGFKEDDPKEFYNHFNKISTPQMIRIIRYLKAWGDNKRCKMPTGLAMTVLALENFQSNNRDDVAMKFTLIEIERALKSSFRCIMPTTPFDNLFENYDETFKSNFLVNLSTFVRDARKAVDEESVSFPELRPVSLELTPNFVNFKFYTLCKTKSSMRRR